MSEFFNINTMQWQDDNLTKAQKIQDWVKQNYPNVQINFRSDGIVTVGNEAFTLTQTQKDNIKAALDAL